MRSASAEGVRVGRWGLRIGIESGVVSCDEAAAAENLRWWQRRV